MDRKRNILIREMMGLIDRAKEIQAKINSTFAEAYDALMRANVLGADVRSIAYAVPVDDCVSILEKKRHGRGNTDRKIHLPRRKAVLRNKCRRVRDG